MICDKKSYIYRAGPVWPTQFELWKPGLVNLFQFMIPSEWLNRGLVIVADKYFTSLPVVKFLGDQKTSIVGPVMDIRIKRIFEKKFFDKNLKKQPKKEFKRKVSVLEYKMPDSDQKIHLHILLDKVSKKPLPFIVSNITLLNNEAKTNCTIERLEKKKAPIQDFYNANMWPVDKVDQTLDNYSLIYPYKDAHWYRHAMHTMVDWILQNCFSLYKSQTPNSKNKTEFLEEVTYDWIGRVEEDFGLFGVCSPPKQSRRYCHLCPTPANKYAKRTKMECIHCKRATCADHSHNVRVCQACHAT